MMIRVLRVRKLIVYGNIFRVIPTVLGTKPNQYDDGQFELQETTSLRYQQKDQDCELERGGTSNTKEMSYYPLIEWCGAAAVGVRCCCCRVVVLLLLGCGVAAVGVRSCCCRGAVLLLSRCGAAAFGGAVLLLQGVRCCCFRGCGAAAVGGAVLLLSGVRCCCYKGFGAAAIRGAVLLSIGYRDGLRLDGVRQQRGDRFGAAPGKGRWNWAFVELLRSRISSGVKRAVASGGGYLIDHRHPEVGWNQLWARSNDGGSAVDSSTRGC